MDGGGTSTDDVQSCLVPMDDFSQVIWRKIQPCLYLFWNLLTCAIVPWLTSTIFAVKLLMKLILEFLLSQLIITNYAGIFQDYINILTLVWANLNGNCIWWGFSKMYVHCAVGWPILYSQKIKVVKLRLAPDQSMPLIEIKIFPKNH